MSRIVIDEERCKGCLLCTEVCPRKLLRLSQKINHQGYKVAEFYQEDDSACTACASCALICPDVAIRVFKTQRGAS